MLHHAMAKKNDDQHVPSRRRERGKRLTSAIWCYVSPEERELIEWCAQLERRAISSWIADIALERAHEMARLYNTVVSPASEKPTTRDLLAAIKKPRKK